MESVVGRVETREMDRERVQRVRLVKGKESVETREMEMMGLGRWVERFLSESSVRRVLVRPPLLSSSNSPQTHDLHLLDVVSLLLRFP